MANSAGDFTFGGQIFEAYWNMFISSMRPVFWVALAFSTVAVAFIGYRTMQGDDAYFLVMRGFAAFWELTNLNPDKVMKLRGYDIQASVYMKNIGTFPPMVESMARWRNLCVWAGGAFTIGAGAALLVYPQIATWFARNQRKRTNERGAFIVAADQLKTMIKDDNVEKAKREREKQLAPQASAIGRAAAWFRGEETEQKEHMEEAQAEPHKACKPPYVPYTIAGFPFPWRHEPTHFFAMGTTGSGKSTVLKDLIAQARQRRDRAVIFDLTGTYIEAFYDPARDTILNPLDVRCPTWSIFNDCSNRIELHTAARALIPSDGGANEPFWTEAARLMFVEACQKLIESNERSNEALYKEIMTSLLPNLHRRLEGTLAGPLTEPEARRMAESVRATLNANAHSIMMLPRQGSEFSIKKWVQEDDGEGRILFIAAKTTHLETLKSLLTLWYDTAIHSLMALPASPDHLRMWFVFDELGALHRLPSLEDGMRTARNFGGAFALGIHTIQQLWSVYGQHEGDTIASLGRTQLYLTQPDYRSADWCSAMIGKTEYREGERSITVGVERIRDGVGWTQRTEYRPLALPDQIMNLPSLKGYLKFPEGYPAALIEVQYRHYPVQAQGFIQRSDFGAFPKLTEKVEEEDPREGAPDEEGRTPTPEERAPAAPVKPQGRKNASRQEQKGKEQEGDKALATEEKKVLRGGVRRRVEKMKAGDKAEPSPIAEEQKPAQTTQKAGEKTPENRADRSRRGREPALDSQRDPIVDHPTHDQEHGLGD